MLTAERIARRRKDRRKLGMKGESDACRLLRGKNYVILCRNYRTRHGEIDIVARDGARLVFVEVKTRRPGSRYDPAANWLGDQRRRLERSALDYLKRTELADVVYAFELVEVVRSRFRLLRLTHRPVERLNASLRG